MSTNRWSSHASSFWVKTTPHFCLLPMLGCWINRISDTYYKVKWVTLKRLRIFLLYLLYLPPRQCIWPWIRVDQHFNPQFSLGLRSFIKVIHYHKSVYFKNQFDAFYNNSLNEPPYAEWSTVLNRVLLFLRIL